VRRAEFLVGNCIAASRRRKLKHKGQINVEEFADHEINRVLAVEDRRVYNPLDALFAGSRPADRKCFT
jgi:hypothetical protein